MNTRFPAGRTRTSAVLHDVESEENAELTQLMNPFTAAFSLPLVQRGACSRQLKYESSVVRSAELHIEMPLRHVFVASGSGVMVLLVPMHEV